MYLFAYRIKSMSGRTWPDFYVLLVAFCYKKRSLIVKEILMALRVKKFMDCLVLVKMYSTAQLHSTYLLEVDLLGFFGRLKERFCCWISLFLKKIDYLLCAKNWNKQQHENEWWFEECKLLMLIISVTKIASSKNSTSIGSSFQNVDLCFESSINSSSGLS